MLAALTTRAQIGISGVADKTVYADQVTFTITNTAGYAFGAWLDNKPVAVGVPNLINRVEYHELSVRATNITTSAVSVVPIPCWSTLACAAW